MSAAQQELVQVEHGHIKHVAELFFQTAGVGGNAAQFVVGRHDSEPGASGPTGPPRWRAPVAAEGKTGGGISNSSVVMIFFLHRCPRRFPTCSQHAMGAGGLARIERCSRLSPKGRRRSQKRRRATAVGADTALPRAASAGQSSRYKLAGGRHSSASGRALAAHADRHSRRKFRSLSSCSYEPITRDRACDWLFSVSVTSLSTERRCSSSDWIRASSILMEGASSRI